jgi:PncC family amidohydrolase
LARVVIVMLSNEDKILILQKKLLEKKQTLGLAESCTGGKLSSLFVDVPGISAIYQGSIVSYSYQAKQDLLNVRSETLQQHGAVSSLVAEQMAVGAQKSLCADWTIAITGVAGPGGGTVEKPVGTVWICVAGPRALIGSRVFKFSGDRLQIQNAALSAALDLLFERLT